MISQDPAVVVTVEEVGVMEDGGAVDAAAIKRRRMVVLRLQYLRLRLQHRPQVPPTRPCQDGQFMSEGVVLRWVVLERKARKPSARQDPCLVASPLLRRRQRRRQRIQNLGRGIPSIRSRQCLFLERSLGNS